MIVYAKMTISNYISKLVSKLNFKQTAGLLFSYLVCRVTTTPTVITLKLYY